MSNRTYPLLCFALIATASATPAKGQIENEILPILLESKLPVLIRTDVADALKLSTEQRVSIKQKFEENLSKGPGRPPSFVPATMIRRVIRRKLRDTEANCLKVLSESQSNRLGELNNQWRGATLAYSEKVQQILQLTTDQRKALRSVRDAFAKSPNPPKSIFLSPEEKMAADRVLTASQRETIKKIGGQPFSFSPNSSTYVVLPKFLGSAQ